MRQTTVIVALMLGLLGGCRQGASETPESKHSWDYSEERGPDHWAEIDEGNTKCGTGELQSPIDLPEQVVEGEGHLTLDYQPDALRIVDNGHTIQINHQVGSSLSLDGQRFRLVQYHFHSPSEHAEQGQRHALELHLVHVDDAGNYAVIGVFLEPAEVEDPAHESLWQHFPQGHQPGERVFVGEQVDPSSFVPATQTHYRYHGSLTTPPCTETVTWLVMREPLRVSAEHIEALRELYRANARPLQPRPQWCLATTPQSE